MTPEKKRILKFLQIVSLKPLRTMRAGTLRRCQLCNIFVAAGDEYRDGGEGKSAHDFCVKAVAREYIELPGRRSGNRTEGVAQAGG